MILDHITTPEQLAQSAGIPLDEAQRLFAKLQQIRAEHQAAMMHILQIRLQLELAIQDPNLN